MDPPHPSLSDDIDYRLEDEENRAALANQQINEPSIQQHMEQAKHNAEVAALQHALREARAEVSTRRAQNGDTKKHAKAKVEEVVRTYESKLASLDSELRAAQDRARMAEKAKTTSAKELEANLAQTISLYSLIQQHQNTIEQQRIKCEHSDAQYAHVQSKLKSAEKELVRLRLLLDKEHDSNERHVSALKGQLAIKSDEVLAQQSRLKTLEEEYAAHKADLEARIAVLEKDRSILEAVNFELRAEREKNYTLAQENAGMKESLLHKAHLEGQHASALEQLSKLTATVSRLEDERASWVGERRDLDHQIGDLTSQLKAATIERDARAIECSAKDKQIETERDEHQRKQLAQAEAARTKEALLQSQVDERNQLLSRAQDNIAQLQSEGDQLRSERKTLLDSAAALEASVRDLQRQGVENRESLEAAHKQLAEVQEQLTTAQTSLAATSAQLASESSRHARTRSSRAALVSKLDQGYEGSYLAQIFVKWKHEWVVQHQVRRLQIAQSNIEALHAERAEQQEEVQRVQREKEEAEAQAAEALRSFEANLIAERDEAAEAVREAQRQCEEQQVRKLGLARREWEHEALMRAEAEREEKMQREARIAAERDKVREEVEEARRIELEALRAKEAREAAVSIARRPSVQSLVSKSVEAALLHHSPPAGRRESSSGAYPRRTRDGDVTDRSTASRSPSERPSRSKLQQHSRRSTLEVPLVSQSAPPPQMHQHQPQPQVQPHQAQPLIPGILFDPAAAAAATAAAAAAGAEAALAADRRARSKSREHRRRHHHHHHHHHSSEREATSPRTHAHHRSHRSHSHSRHRSSSPPPSTPPLTATPFGMAPINFAHMTAMQQPFLMPSMTMPQPFAYAHPHVHEAMLSQPQQAQQMQQPQGTTQPQPQPQPQQPASAGASSSQRAKSHRRSSSEASGLSRAGATAAVVGVDVPSHRPSSRRASATAALPASASSRPPSASAASSAVSSGRKSVSSGSPSGSALPAPSLSHSSSSSSLKSRAAAAKVPPLPLHRAQPQAQGLKEAARETTLAAGSPLDTTSPSPPAPAVAPAPALAPFSTSSSSAAAPSAAAPAAAAPSFGADDQLERERLTQGLDFFLTLQAASDPTHPPSRPTHKQETAAGGAKGTKSRLSSSTPKPTHDEAAIAAAVVAAKKRIGAAMAVAKK